MQGLLQVEVRNLQNLLRQNVVAETLDELVEKVLVLRGLGSDSIEKLLA